MIKVKGNSVKKILFVCLGNICRSPMAEYLFRDAAQKRGLAVEAASAGTSGWHDGEFMHCGTAEVLDGLGIDSAGFVSSKVADDAFAVYDYVLVMDEANLRDMRVRFGWQPEKLMKITDLLPAGSEDHVPDPWYTGNFIQTRDILSRCCDELLRRLESGEM